jgi:hypothetical protein
MRHAPFVHFVRPIAFADEGHAAPTTGNTPVVQLRTPSLAHLQDDEY